MGLDPESGGAHRGQRMQTSPPAASDRPSWIAPSLIIALLGSAGLALFAVVVTYHNVIYSYWRLVDIVTGAASVDARTAVPAWVLPFLQDLSLVSPGLVLTAAACAAVAAWTLLRQPQQSLRWPGPYFPFPAAYKVYFIQMGLLGTIIGFVMAFAEVDPRAERQSVILLEALGTALWSTLTAILLAYAVCPLVEIYFQACRRQLAAAPTANTGTALDSLRLRTVAAAEALADLAGSSRALAEEARALGDQVSERRLDVRLAHLESDVARLLEELRHIVLAQTELGARVAALDTVPPVIAALGERLLASERAAAETSVRLDGAVHTDTRHTAELARIDEELRALRRERERIDGLEAWLRNLAPFRGTRD